VAQGTQEITLLGQTVDSYRDASLPPPVSSDPDESQFPHLLRAIAHRVPALRRLRYTSPHPRHATPELARAHAELDVLAWHVHMPVQSGADRVLKRMIRRYTRSEYIERVRRLAAARPGLTLSTDIIVGFPGETRAEFEETLSLVREVGFVGVFAFKYSQRPFTPALKLADDVSEAEKSERLAELFSVAEELTRAHLAQFVGTTQEVLILGPSKSPSDSGQGTTFQGRTRRNEIVHVQVPAGIDATGAFLDASITQAFKHSLRGEVDAQALAALPARPVPEGKRGRRKLPVLTEAR
jgi:tRNA-2-methylthio-N6-dimethylallyladenosine synthase